MSSKSIVIRPVGSGLVPNGIATNSSGRVPGGGSSLLVEGSSTWASGSCVADMGADGLRRGLLLQQLEPFAPALDRPSVGLGLGGPPDGLAHLDQVVLQRRGVSGGGRVDLLPAAVALRREALDIERLHRLALLRRQHAVRVGTHRG